MPSSANKTTDKDRDCAVFARAALFPDRMLRDGATHSLQFPALLELENYREKLQHQHNTATQAYVSVASLFPKNVVVVRNFKAPDSNDNDLDGIEWNGRPDCNPVDASFPVVPNRLRVRCTSDCSSHLPSSVQKAYVETTPSTDTPSTSGVSSTNDDRTTKTVVLCSDRVLKRDYQEGTSSGLSTVLHGLPEQSLRHVEEVLAHQLAKLDVNNNGSSSSKESSSSSSDTIIVQSEIDAARAAECYYSKHKYNDKIQIRKGSGLPVGFSLMPQFLQNRMMNGCIYSTAVQNLKDRDDIPNANEQVRDAMKKKN